MLIRSRNAFAFLGLIAAVVLLAQLLVAQARPKVTAVEPQAGKVNDDITLTGENLGKEAVSAVFLSDDTVDHKAAFVEQTDDKIVMKVPQVKAGKYNVAIQVGDQIFVLPLRFNVQ